MPIPSQEQWLLVNDELDRLLELPERDRSAAVSEIERTQPELARELRALLSASREQGFADFLAGPSPVAAAGAGSRALAGQCVGPYVIEAEIGRGGMGSVWRAVRADGRFEGHVAIKFVHASWLGRDGEARFRQEGVMLARLDHPHIARLIDAGALESGQPYLVLEYVEGVPIDEYCEQHTLDLEDRLRLFLGVLAAVAHAHSHLIVHRDIKPSNIFVTRAGVAKLLDFGIAKLLQAGDGDRAPTHSTAAALTPDYAAPEQLLGLPVTTATDVYALGLVLYRLLTGTHPVARESRSTAEFVRALLDREPAPASVVAAGPAARRRALAGDLDNILAKALKKDPAERYPTVGALADDLERHLAHQPVLARPDTASYRLGKFVRRHRGSVLGGVLVACGLVGTSAFALLQMLDARAQRDLAQAEARRSGAQSELLEFLLGDALSEAPHDAVRQRLDRARELVRRRFRSEPTTAAQLLIGLSGRYVDSGDAAGASEVMGEAEAISRGLNDPALDAEIACGRAQDAIDAGDLALARRYSERASAEMQHLRAVPVSLSAECAVAAAFVAQGAGDFAESSRGLREAVRALEQAGLQRSSRYTSVAHELARSLTIEGDFRGAWELESAVIATAADSGRADSSGYYAMLTVAARSLRDGGQPRRSLEFVDSAVAAARRATPQVELPYFLAGLRSWAQLDLGLPRQAEAGLATAAETAEREGSRGMAAAFAAAAIRAAIEDGDLPLARQRWAALAPLATALQAGSPYSREVVLLRLTHARLQLAERAWPEAAREVDAAAAAVAARSHPTRLEGREIELLQARIALARDDPAAAAQHAGAALELARQQAVDPASSAWIGEAMVWQARSEAAGGATTQARATAQAALPHLEQNLDPAHPLLKIARELAGPGR
ncbi:MAG: protein kinase [Proteobacteria bacterium]|nr:protein kinase [Pseudomonadota bacterium]